MRGRFIDKSKRGQPWDFIEKEIGNSSGWTNHQSTSSWLFAHLKRISLARSFSSTRSPPPVRYSLPEYCTPWELLSRARTRLLVRRAAVESVQRPRGPVEDGSWYRKHQAADLEWASRPGPTTHPSPTSRGRPWLSGSSGTKDVTPPIQENLPGRPRNRNRCNRTRAFARQFNSHH